MSIKYSGKTDIKEKINLLIDEMINDDELTYTIKINENRTDETITELQIEISDIRKEKKTNFKIGR